jgi:hypothetical protein
VFKRPATPVRGRHRETREIERHQDSKRDLQKRVISQQGNELPASTRQQNRQSNKATDTELTAEQQSTRQRTQPSTRQQNRQSTRQRTQPSTRQQNRQSTRERVQSQESRITENATVCKSGNQQGNQKTKTRVSRGRQARPTQSATIQPNKTISSGNC